MNFIFIFLERDKSIREKKEREWVDLKDQVGYLDGDPGPPTDLNMSNMKKKWFERKAGNK